MLKARIREGLSEQELELEIQEIAALGRRELLLARTEIEMAKIDVAVEEQQRTKEEAELNKRSQIDRYKRPCDLPTGFKGFPQCKLGTRKLEGASTAIIVPGC
ncbi:unnamed protein product [Echinostoma caproni]|uniref:Uncharacterized protein n=1 Tax=Echinostoma caproni TaxID=27848 RepID=A0A3P8LCB4_9TREM|nr:unnamed protein product [Echinostoma caproni]